MADEKASVTVADLDGLMEEIFESKSAYEKKGREKAVAFNNFVALKAKAVAYLKELKRTDYKSDAGDIRISRKWQVKLPQSSEEKTKLFDWMREKEIFDKYATVNSRSLNSLHKAERESAIERGEGMVWKMPGIEDATLFEDLTTKKGT